MAKNNNTLVFNGLMQGMSWDLIKEIKDEIRRYQGEKPPTRKDILTDWIIGKDYMLQQQGKSYLEGGFAGIDWKSGNFKYNGEGGEPVVGNTNWLGAASSALQLAGDAFSGYNDIENKKDEFNTQLNQFQNQRFNIGDNAFLASEWDNRMLLGDAPTRELFGYKNGWKVGLSALQNGLTTAATTGNIWLGAGMAVADIAKNIGLNLKAESAQDEALKRYNIAQGLLPELFNYSADLALRINTFNQLQNMAKNGGHLALKGGKNKNKYAMKGSLADKYKYTTLGTLLGPPEMTYTKTPEEYQKVLDNEALVNAILLLALSPITMSSTNNWPTVGYVTLTGIPFFIKGTNNSTAKEDNEVKEISKRIGIEYSKGGKLKKSHKFAEGGLLNTYDYGLEEVNAGGSHEENPNEGVVVSYAPDGLPNKVEEGETIHNDYVYSKRLEANKKVLNNNLLDEKYEGKSFADISKKLTEDRKQRPNDPISIRTNEENLNRLQDALEELKLDNKTKEVKRFLGSLNNDLLNALQLEMMDEYEAYAELLAQQLEQEDLAYQEEQAALEGMFGKGGHLKQGVYGNSFLWNDEYIPEDEEIFYGKQGPIIINDKFAYEVQTPKYSSSTNPDYVEPVSYGTFIEESPKSKEKPKDKTEETSYSSLAPLRFAEAFGSAGLYLSDILGLTNQPDYSNARMYQRAIDNIGGVNFTPVGNYLTYIPIDTEYLANQQMATAAARRKYGNVAGDYTLGILNDYNTLNQIGATAIAARQQDLEQRHKFAEFNKATNEKNSMMSLDAQKQNASLRALRALEYRQLANMMTEERNTNEAARAANYQTFMSNVAAVGREDYNYDFIRWAAQNGLLKPGALKNYPGLFGYLSK